MKRPVTILFFLLLMMTSVVAAQTKVQADNIVTKNFSKVIALAPGDIFSITGEKADITLKGWDKNYAELKITFSAEHKDRTIAVKEVEYMHYSLSREKNTVELRNAFILPSRADLIQSRVKVVMTLMVPSKNTFSIYNKYGNAELNDLSGNLSVALEFCDLVLNHISGKINIQSLYSEVRGAALAPSSFISNDEESKYVMALDNGTYVFNSKHGDLDLTLGGVQSITVNATHTDVTIQPIDHAYHNYQLLSKEGKIYVPKEFANPVKVEDKQSRFVLTRTSSNSLIDIKTTFNTITIQ